ncbi:MAG: RtcB family protein [Cytophagaceae bacterium]|nr:RtcB family protein [Cytophagaceae bacterium]
MSTKVLSGKDLRKIGFPEGRVIGVIVATLDRFYKNKSKTFKLDLMKDLYEHPDKYEKDEVLGRVVYELRNKTEKKEMIELNPSRLEYKTYGGQDIEEGAKNQMEIAMKLPVTLAGALMPDAHQGYGLPIGGVLATENAVIPYGVGVDIGCKMCLTLYDLPVAHLEQKKSELKRILQDNTRFGSAVFKKPEDDSVLEREEFSTIKIVKHLKDRACSQIGSSGSGNHFVEFGTAEILTENEFNVLPGKYLAVLSHSGSRGLGAEIARYYTKLAMDKCKLPSDAKHLAWLDLNTEEGQEYWLAMNLAGDYASACHHQIHKRISKALGQRHLAMVENHHNFAWKEKLGGGKEVIVHRKGATPAGKGVFGIIPGSMTAPGFIVKGKGNKDSINSASHGAGRLMSRSKAKQNITHKDLRQILEKYGVELMGGDLDEAPMAYKDIQKVMDYQKELVEVIGIFNPKIVRMCGGRE